MAYSDALRSGSIDSATFGTIASLIDALFSSTGPLAWTKYDPTWGVAGGGSWSVDPGTDDACYYSVIGDLTAVRIYGVGTLTGTCSYLSVTLPSTPAATVAPGLIARDNSNNYGGFGESSGGTLNCWLYNKAAFTAAAGAGVKATFFYLNTI